MALHNYGTSATELNHNETPMQLCSSNLQGQNIPATQIPTSQEAVAAYENLGGRLTAFPSFDLKPLADNVALQDIRE